jgi:hypothetical protein
LANTGEGYPLDWYLVPQANGNDLSAHDNASGDGAERHGEARRHASSTGCNTITRTIIIAAVAIDGMYTNSNVNKSQTKTCSCTFPAFQRELDSLLDPFL